MVKIIMQNVRGLNIDVKHKSVFNFLRNQADIICMQETHSCKQTKERWELEWGNPKECFWSHGTRSS